MNNTLLFDRFHRESWHRRECFFIPIFLCLMLKNYQFLIENPAKSDSVHAPLIFSPVYGIIKIGILCSLRRTFL